MKFGQLIEYNMRNVFLEKVCTKYGGEASPRSFYKKSKLSLSLNQQKCYKVCFYWMVKSKSKVLTKRRANCIHFLLDRSRNIYYTSSHDKMNMFFYLYAL